MNAATNRPRLPLTRLALGLLAVGLGLILPGRLVAADPPKRPTVPDRTPVKKPAPPPVEENWKALAEEMSQVIRLEVLEALANKADAKRYPLAAPSAFQKAVLAVNEAQKPDARKKASERAPEALTAPHLKAKFGRLPDVTPNGKTTIQSQHDKLVVARKSLLPQAALDDLVDGDFKKEIENLKVEVKKGSGKPPANAVKTLRLELVGFECVDETSGPGTDDVFLGGTAINVLGKASKVKYFELGQFDSGDKRTYNPAKKLVDFDLTQSNKYPKVVTFVLLVCEQDSGDTMTEALNELTALLKTKVEKELKKKADELGVAVADLIGSSEFGAVVSGAVGKIAGAVIAELFELLEEWWGDEMFDPITIQGKVSKPEIWGDGATHGPTHTYTASGHGAYYKLKVRWAKAN